ncbi:MAG: family 16 glycoside hydrolase, partial [Fimbriiglobus sp.]
LKTESARGGVSIPGHGDKRVRAMAFDPTGTRLATIAADGTARVWDAATGAELMNLRTRFAAEDAARYSLEFDGTGMKLLGFGPPGRAAVWDWEKKTEISRWESADLGAVAFTPDGQGVITAGFGRRVRGFSLGKTTPFADFDTTDGPVVALAVDAERNILLTGHEAAVRVWDWAAITKPDSPTPPADPPPGFTSIFTGTDRTGWNPRPDDPPDIWSVGNGILSGTKPDNERGGWLLTDAEFTNFEWQFEYRLLAVGANGGCAVRAGSADPAYKRLEVNLADDINIYDVHGAARPFDKTGAGTGTAGPSGVAQGKRLGNWNAVRVVAEGRRVFVWVNGKSVQACELPDSPRRGRLGVQVFEGRVEYRNLWVRPFVEPVADGDGDNGN